MEFELNNQYQDLDLDLIFKKIINNLQVINQEEYAIENLLINEKREIELSLERVDVARKYIVKNGQINLFNVRNLTKEFERILKGFIMETSELAIISSNLKSFAAIKRQYKIIQEYDPNKQLASFFTSIYDFQNYSYYIDRHVNDQGEMKNEASTKLEQIRSRINQLEYAIRVKIEELSKQFSNYLTSESYTIKDSNFVLPVNVNYKSKIKGYIHDYSASGKTIFVEPTEVIKLKNELNSEKSEERKEIERLCKTITSYIFNVANEMCEAMAKVMEIDIIFAKGLFAYDYDCVKQVISNTINVHNVRHVLIEKPILNNLLFESKKAMVISGSNTGGKTVNLKIIGIFALLTKLGCPLPAERAEFPIFKNIYTIMGDGQKITANLSTFASHVLKIKQIVETVSANDLVLLDELGTSTDPIEGAALAISVFKNIIDVGATAVLTTHYPEVKNFALTSNNIVSTAVQFDLEKIEPTYKLVYNQTANSNALLIAQKYGLPLSILNDAEKILEDNDDFMNNSKLTKLMDEFERGVQANNHRQKDLELIIAQEKGKIKMLEQKYQKRLEEAIKAIKKNYESQINELDIIVKENIQFAKMHHATKAKTIIKNLAQAEQMQASLQTTNSELKNEFKINDLVLVRDRMIKGKITEITGDKVIVQRGSFKIKTNLNKLELIDKAVEVKKGHAQIKTTQVRQPQVYNYSINLIGMRYTNASEVLLKELDTAILKNAQKITIIHGFGTGVLKKLTRERLKNNKYIKEFRDGDATEGGLAVTIAYLKGK